MSKRPVRFSAEKALQRLLKDTDSDSDAEDSDNDNTTNMSASVCSDGDNQRNINVSDDSDQENNGQSDDEEDALNDEEHDNLLPEANTVPSNTYISKDGTSWSRIPVNMRSGRLPSCNVLRRRGGPTRFIENRVDTEVDVFDELFGPQTIEDIVSYTNDEAQRQGHQSFNLTCNEFRSFLGLLLIRGVLKGKNEPIHMFWNKSYGRPIFHETMPRNRFQLILRFVRFDDKTTRNARRENDKYAPLRALWETVTNNFTKCFFPKGSVTVDEQLFSTKSRCSFIQYMPQKPGKFGLKFWLICDTSTSYVLNAVPYTGRDDRRPPEQGLGEHVVRTLVEPYYGSGITVTTDNFFTSLNLSDHLRRNDVSMVGTMRANRREIPSQIKDQNRQRTIQSSEFVFTDTAMLVSYKAKPTKMVYVLSSAHNQPDIASNDPKKRPDVVLFYNKEKAGVDTADQMLRGYSTKSATKRWPLSAFFNLLDMVALNCYILCVDLEITKQRRYEFLISIGEKLCFSQHQLQISPQVTEPASEPEQLPPGKRTHCRICSTNKTRIQCFSCRRFICGQCSAAMCKKCKE